MGNFKLDLVSGEEYKISIPQEITFNKLFLVENGFFYKDSYGKFKFCITFFDKKITYVYPGVVDFSIEISLNLFLDYIIEKMLSEFKVGV